MGKVILDAETRAKLNGLTQQLELYDEQGNLLGYYTPVDSHLHGADLPGPDPFSDEEIAEALKHTDPGRPLADILRDLRNR
jgi:hypothetical protein